MKKRAVSVIIPMYNGEAHIARCLESILNQSFKEIEIIIVDDNSDDDSYKIIEEYSKIHPYIKYIKNNICMGPAMTRNRGLKHASSEYILFLDCDDWIDLNCIEKAVRKFETNPDIDIVLWEIKTAYEYNKISSRYEYIFDNILSNTMALNLLSHHFENEYFLSPLMGCKLFRKDLLDRYEIVFHNTLYEDDAFTFMSFWHAKKIALITGSCLYYYQHSSSLTHHFTGKYIADFFEAFVQLYNDLENAPKDCFYKFFTKSLQSMLDCMCNSVTDPDLLRKYKASVFSKFYESINIEEYYSYSFSITI